MERKTKNPTLGSPPPHRPKRQLPHQTPQDLIHNKQVSLSIPALFLTNSGAFAPPVKTTEEKHTNFRYPAKLERREQRRTIQTPRNSHNCHSLRRAYPTPPAHCPPPSILRKDRTRDIPKIGRQQRSNQENRGEPPRHPLTHTNATA